MSNDETPHNPAYPDGAAGILEHMNARRAPLSFAEGEALPPLDCDLKALSNTVVEMPVKGAGKMSGNARKSWEISKELKGQNALLHLNGLLIAHLRKRAQPSHTAELFVRLWAEQAPLLIREMDLRWKISSLTTFGDHGVTPEQRSVGLGLSTLFGTMKLYESERLFSGRPADRPFTLDGRANGPLPLDMNAYSLTDGGLDTALIGRLWEEADKDDVIRPLAHDLLQRLIDDPRTVFRRLHRLRARKLRRIDQKPADTEKTIHVAVPERKTATPSWGVVCTTNANVLEVTRFVAHHLELGAKHIYLFLDAPDREVTDLLGDFDNITLTVCDGGYWHDLGKDRPEEHQLRQVFNATRALRMAKDRVDWLGHIDVDEFVLSQTKLATALKKVPDSMAAIRLRPAEALASSAAGVLPKRFKLRCVEPHVTPDAIHDIYPTFGSYLRGGFMSHLAGKIFARTGLGDIRLAIHRIRSQGRDIENIYTLPTTYIGHLHAPDWDSFLSKLSFRQSKGSYRVRADEPEKSIGRLLAYLTEEEGEDGLRVFFDEMCLDSADLRNRLKRHNLLLEPKFDPDSAIGKLFGVEIGDN